MIRFMFAAIAVLLLVMSCQRAEAQCFDQGFSQSFTASQCRPPVVQALAQRTVSAGRTLGRTVFCLRQAAVRQTRQRVQCARLNFVATQQRVQQRVQYRSRSYCY